MPAATATKDQREIVRLLTLQHGHKKAAELSGVPYDLVRQWSVRGNWKVVSQPVTTSLATVAADNVASQLQDHERKTKLGLATYASKQADHLAKNGKLKDSGHFKNVAGGASIVHRWDAKSENTQNVVVNVALLGVQPSEVSVEARNVESESQDSGQ